MIVTAKNPKLQLQAFGLVELYKKNSNISCFHPPPPPPKTLKSLIPGPFSSFYGPKSPKTRILTNIIKSNFSTFMLL